jgi:flagellar hook-length control protein FliK
MRDIRPEVLQKSPGDADASTSKKVNPSDVPEPPSTAEHPQGAAHASGANSSAKSEPSPAASVAAEQQSDQGSASALPPVKAGGEGSGTQGGTLPQHHNLVTKPFQEVVKEAVSTRSAEIPNPLPAELTKGLIDQVAKVLAMRVEEKSSTMRLTLDPPSLGEVMVKVRVEDGRMQAQVDVTQVGVKVAIEANIPQLRQALSDNGIELHRLDVFAPGETLSREAGEGHQERQRRRGGSKPQSGTEPVASYQTAKSLGYNTMEVIM